MSESIGTPSRAASPLAARVRGTVRIVGSGLLGSSIGHALMARGIDVALDDTSPSQLRLAIDYGALFTGESLSLMGKFIAEKPDLWFVSAKSATSPELLTGFHI